VHARNAVFETQNANPKAALQEHELAAGEFANAREGTGDSEVRLVSANVIKGVPANCHASRPSES